MKKDRNNIDNFKAELAQLRAKNPWVYFDCPCGTYMPFLSEQSIKSKWIFALCDETAIERYVEKKKKSVKQTNKFFFNLDPAPWIGKWNVEKEDELPELVILSLNPGIGYNNFIIKETESYCTIKRNGEIYHELMRTWLYGNATSSEILLNPVWQHYNGYYWLKKLSELCGIDKDCLFLRNYSDDFRKKLDKIMFIDLCPYHSINRSAVGKLLTNDNKPIFKSMEFTKRLVKMFIRHEKKIIISRPQNDWIKFVSELETYEHCYILSSSQNASISSGNVIHYSDKDKESSKELKQEVFNKIKETLL